MISVPYLWACLRKAVNLLLVAVLLTPLGLAKSAKPDALPAASRSLAAKAQVAAVISMRRTPGPDSLCPPTSEELKEANSLEKLANSTLATARGYDDLARQALQAEAASSDPNVKAMWHQTALREIAQRNRLGKLQNELFERAKALKAPKPCASKSSTASQPAASTGTEDPTAPLLPPDYKSTKNPDESYTVVTPAGNTFIVRRKANGTLGIEDAPNSVGAGRPSKSGSATGVNADVGTKPTVETSPAALPINLINPATGRPISADEMAAMKRHADEEAAAAVAREEAARINPATGKSYTPEELARGINPVTGQPLSPEDAATIQRHKAELEAAAEERAKAAQANFLQGGPAPAGINSTSDALAPFPPCPCPGCEKEWTDYQTAKQAYRGASEDYNRIWHDARSAYMVGGLGYERASDAASADGVVEAARKKAELLDNQYDKTEALYEACASQKCPSNQGAVGRPSGPAGNLPITETINANATGTAAAPRGPTVARNSSVDPLSPVEDETCPDCDLDYLVWQGDYSMLKDLRANEATLQQAYNDAVDAALKKRGIDPAAYQANPSAFDYNPDNDVQPALIALNAAQNARVAAEKKVAQDREDYLNCVADCHRKQIRVGEVSPTDSAKQNGRGQTANPPKTNPPLPSPPSSAPVIPSGPQLAPGSTPPAGGTCGGIGQPTCNDAPSAPTRDITGTILHVQFDNACPQCRGDYERYVDAVNRVIKLEAAFYLSYSEYGDAYNVAIAQGISEAALATGSIDINKVDPSSAIGKVAAAAVPLENARRELAAAKEDRTNKYKAYSDCLSKCHSLNANEVAGKLPQDLPAKPASGGAITPPPGGLDQNTTGKNNVPNPQLPPSQLGPYPVEDPACFTECNIAYLVWLGAYLKLQDLISKNSPPEAQAIAKAEMDTNRQEYLACVAECHKTLIVTPDLCGGLGQPSCAQPCTPGSPGCKSAPGTGAEATGGGAVLRPGTGRQLITVPQGYEKMHPPPPPECSECDDKWNKAMKALQAAYAIMRPGFDERGSQEVQDFGKAIDEYRACLATCKRRLSAASNQGLTPEDERAAAEALLKDKAPTEAARKPGNTPIVAVSPNPCKPCESEWKALGTAVQKYDDAVRASSLAFKQAFEAFHIEGQSITVDRERAENDPVYRAAAEKTEAARVKENDAQMKYNSCVRKNCQPTTEKAGQPSIPPQVEAGKGLTPDDYKHLKEKFKDEDKQLVPSPPPTEEESTTPNENEIIPSETRKEIGMGGKEKGSPASVAGAVANCAYSGGLGTGCSYDSNNGDLTLEPAAAGSGGGGVTLMVIQIMIVGGSWSTAAVQLNDHHSHSEFAGAVVPPLRAPPIADSSHTHAGGLQLASYHRRIDASGRASEELAHLLAPPQINSTKTSEFKISVVANGNSSGEAFELQVLDPTGKVKHVRVPEGTILEPMKRGPAPPVATTRGGNALKQPLTAYCVEFSKEPPEAGMLYRVAPQVLQDKYKSLRSVLQAGRELVAAGKLHPDSEAQQYFDAIQQYALWSKLENWDAAKFGEMFTERTKKNAQAMNVKWTKQMEQAVRSLVPGRWRDISMELEEAEKLAHTPAQAGAPAAQQQPKQ